MKKLTQILLIAALISSCKTTNLYYPNLRELKAEREAMPSPTYYIPPSYFDGAKYSPRYGIYFETDSIIRDTSLFFYNKDSTTIIKIKNQ
jgi:hypothetical protein